MEWDKKTGIDVKTIHHKDRLPQDKEKIDWKNQRTHKVKGPDYWK